MSKIKTVRRAKWHRGFDRWQVQDEEGGLWATAGSRPRPIEIEGGCPWENSRPTANNTWTSGPLRDPPEDFTTTLRRIINPPQKA
jgi:hypothetical protein